MNAETWLSLSKYALYIGTALVAIGTISVSHFSSVVDRAKGKKIDELLNGNRALQSGNQELLGKVERYQSDLEEKQREIEKLNIEATKSRRGIVSTWDFNGVRREGTAGSMTAIVGEEVGVFKELGRLERERKFPEVIELATHQIERTPGWLTPYLLRGAAYANLGETREAIADLQHVVKEAAGDPAYAQASAMLGRLQSSGK